MLVEPEKLRQALVGGTHVDEEVFARAVAESEENGRSLLAVLSEAGCIGDDRAGRAAASVVGLPFARLSRRYVPDHVLRILPESAARRAGAVVFATGDGVVGLAMADPEDLATARLVEKKTGLRAAVHFATARGLEAVMDKYRNGLEAKVTKFFAPAPTKPSLSRASGADAADDGAAALALRAILAYAKKNGASEITIEPDEAGATVRCRIGNATYDAAPLSAAAADAVVACIMRACADRTGAGDARREEGRITVMIDGAHVFAHVRVAQEDERKVVHLRLVTEEEKNLGIGNLGFSNRDLHAIARQAQKSFGAMLFVGPAGSGTTTTAYAVLSLFDAKDMGVATVEEPVECGFADVRQVDVESTKGETVASCLREIVKGDPDVIMVGELHGAESATVALRAAETGHFLISTVVANGAVDALARLRAMGVDSPLVAASVNGVVAQRLVRRVCAHCATSIPANRDELLGRGLSEAFVRRLFASAPEDVTPRLQSGNGCDRCGYTGYLGRVGIFEVLEVDDAMRELIVQNADARDMVRQAVRSGMTTMVEDGIRKVVAGLTTIDEIMKEIG